MEPYLFEDHNGVYWIFSLKHFSRLNQTKRNYKNKNKTFEVLIENIVKKTCGKNEYKLTCR